MFNVGICVLCMSLNVHLLFQHQRLHQQQQLIDCLKSENAKHETKTSLNALSEALEESKQHRKESRLLKEELQRLHKELSQLQAKNNHLTKVSNITNENNYFLINN